LFFGTNLSRQQPITSEVYAFRCVHLKAFVVFRSSILTAALLLVAVDAVDTIAQQPAGDSRMPSAFDQPLFGQESFDKPQSLRRAEIDSYLRSQRDAFDYRQRILAAEEKSRIGIAMLRPNRPSNPRMHSYYSPRRIIYVPYFVD
jgi:hypothetical protein